MPASAQENKTPTDFQSLASAATTARDHDNPEEAIRDYRQALELQPAWQEGWWSLGILEYGRDHYAEAIPAFAKLTELAPGGSPAWTFLGLCEYETKQYDSALQHLSRAQQLGGTDDPEILRVAKYHLALLRIHRGEFRDAATILPTLSAQGAAGMPIKTALGLATLRVRLLPPEIDPSKEALLQEVGSAAMLEALGPPGAALTSYETLLRKYSDEPYLRLAYASALFTAGKYTDAQREAEQELALSPQSSASHALLAKILASAGQPDKASEQLKLAAKLQSQETIEEARDAERYTNPSSPADVAVKSANGSDQSDDVLWKAAMASYDAQQYAEALTALKRYVEPRPNAGTAWAVMGLSEFALKDYDNALIHLQRGQSLGLQGNFASVQLARYRLAILLDQRGEFETAEELLMSVAGRGPLEAEVREALGISLLRRRTWPNQTTSPDKPLTVAAGGIAELLSASKYDEAFARFEALIRNYPAAPFLHYAYGTALLTFSRYDEAADQFQKEISLSPGSALPYLQLASAALKQHRAGNALAPAEKAARLAPDSSEAHYVLGRTYLELAKDQAAIEELEKASALAPQSPQIHFNLAKAYSRSNLPEKAEQERATFARLNAAAEEQRSLRGSQAYGAHASSESPLAPADPTKDRNSNPTPNAN